MIKFLAAALVMTFVIPAHALTINNQCEGVSMAYSSALSKITRTCSILEQCQNLRTKCPQQIDEVATCDVFNSCMSEQFAEDATRSRKCVYEWTPESNGPGKCENKNQSFDIVANRCPGLSLFGDVFQDKNFNCDGHKGRYWSEHAAFQSAKRLYEDAMKDGRCRFVELSQPPSCSAAFRSVSVTDNSHGGVAEIIDGPRDGHDSMGNIFEFQSQFPAHSAANENEFPAGSFR